MRIQPRRQILNVWSALLASCYRDGKWIWGGIAGSNSISDAEQLLCILYPATQIDSFALHDPDRISDDVRQALDPLGRRVGQKIVEVLDEYLERYEQDGQPIFSADSYLRYPEGAEPTDLQRKLDVVDSYSMSLTLCLAGLQFLSSLRGVSNRRSEQERLEKLLEPVDRRLNQRLTAAMVGLVRSFVVRSVDPLTADGQAMLTMFNQTRSEPEAVVAGVARRLDRVRSRLLREATLNKTPDADLADEGLLIECGWSWGIVRDAEEIKFVDVPLSSSRIVSSFSIFLQTASGRAR